MRVLMLGWEFPPFISGGLGTACYGLTKALNNQQTKVLFVLPKAVGTDFRSHVRVIAPQAPQAALGDRSPNSVASTYAVTEDGSRSASNGQARKPASVTRPKPVPAKANLKPEDAAALAAKEAAEAAQAAEDAAKADAKATPQPSAAPQPTPTPAPSPVTSAQPAPQPGSQPVSAPDDSPVADDPAFSHVVFKAVPSRIISPYQTAPGQTYPPQAVGQAGPTSTPEVEEFTMDGQISHAPPPPISVLDGAGLPPHVTPAPGSSPAGHYQGDMVAETRRYADLVMDLVEGEEFDVIHAHDWMTFPAGLAIAALTGKPLVVHVHSTEFDRSGNTMNKQVYEIERRGMHGACRVITVSHFTKSIVERHYGIDTKKVDVIYNGIENGLAKKLQAKPPRIGKGDKVVLYLGRITMQKGPEYFIEAARKVLQKYEDVKFVVAGTGDKVREIIELAAEAGIGQKVLFTGFLRGDDVERVFRMADVYVMPSVSEPFGIAPLEAITHDVPVIISKQSGVSEVLSHALKVDFWDTDDMADKILAVLKHPPLRASLRENAEIEAKRLTWDDAARECVSTYERAAEMVPIME